jgi:polysaccharide export outer membrane protein
MIAAALLVAGCTDARVFRGPSEAVHVGYHDGGLFGELAYRFGCGDVLEVTFADRPVWDCLASVGLDGRLPLGGAGAPLAEGATAEEVRLAVARWTGLDPERVSVRLADPRAARVYVHGPEAGRQRVIAYRGPEPVVEFLWRVGAIKQGSTDLRDVYVVRPNVAAGGRAEVFRVDVEAVVLDGDHRSDVVLQPSDQVYVGETRRSRFSRLLPHWLRPLYRKLVGMLPPDGWPWAPKEAGPAARPDLTSPPWLLRASPRPPSS